MRALDLARRRVASQDRTPYATVAGGDAAALALAVAVTGISPSHVLYAVVAWFAFGGRFRGHDRFDLTIGTRASGVIGRAGGAALIVAPFALLRGESGLLLTAAVSAAAVLLLRSVTYAIARRNRARSVPTRTIIIGARRTGQDLARILRDDPRFRSEVVGFVDDDAPSTSTPHDGAGAMPPLLGGSADLPWVVLRHGVERVIVAYGALDDARLVELFRECEDVPLDVYLVPRLFELGLPTTEGMTDDVLGYPLIRHRRPRSTVLAGLGKRTFDLVVASTMIVLTGPLMAMAALAVRISGPGPILFRQERIGRHGRPFQLLKFRSMRQHDQADTLWSADGDARVTSVGRILRPTSIDELPQLFNVLRGDMSIVGPRPERPAFTPGFSREISAYWSRHRTEVGITGLAQVSGLRGDTSLADRARLDNGYIEQWSLWMDIVILARTASEVMRSAWHALRERSEGRSVVSTHGPSDRAEESPHDRTPPSDRGAVQTPERTAAA